MKTEKLNTWIEISRKAYANNLSFFKKLISPTTELSVVIKSNAYGHGILEIAGLAIEYGADSFCVHSLDEALLLEESGYGQDILIMGHVPLKRLDEAIHGNFRLVMYNMDSLRELDQQTRRLNQTARVHLKLETGTNRQGVDENQLPGFLEHLKSASMVKLEAVYTHFANADEPANHEYARYQLERFDEMYAQIQTEFPTTRRHASGSAAVLLLPRAHFDMIRLGISQYGLWPSAEVRDSFKMNHSLKEEGILQPILSWKTRVSQIKEVPANHFISYGRTYRTDRDSRIVVLPTGYSDGYDRLLSNKSYVLINGRRAPVRGRVCMNLTMVDVTDIPDVKLEDEVVLIGSQGDDSVSADYLASLIGTINYEIVTRISSQIPRIVID
jgi:alanine racemase